MTKEISRELQLEVLGEDDVTKYAFAGAGNITKEKLKPVRLWIRSQYNRMEDSVEALEISGIYPENVILPEHAVHKSQGEDIYRNYPILTRTFFSEK